MPMTLDKLVEGAKDSDSVIVKVRILLALLDTSVDNGFYWGFLLYLRGFQDISVKLY